MAFRTVEITGPAELHVKNGTLVIEKEIENTEGSKSEKSRAAVKRKRTRQPETLRYMIPLEDISTIVCMGAELRISTMAMARICQSKITMAMLDEKYRTAGLLTPYEANVRQSLTMRRQVYMEKNREDCLWRQIVKRKILNQAATLEFLGLQGAESVRKYAENMSGNGEIDTVEAGAAREYFAVLCPDMNRREESPMNSRLNYGYSIIRNSLIRAVIAAGLLPSFGIHHQNLYNAYNLADDLIEPFRPCVDIIAYSMEGSETSLAREECKQLASVLQHAVNMDKQKISVLQAVDRIVNGYRNYIMEENEYICLPELLPAEIIRQIKE